MHTFFGFQLKLLVFKTYRFCEYIEFKWMITATSKLISILLFMKVWRGGGNGVLIMGGAYITNCTVYI